MADKIPDNRDSFEFNVGMSGFTLKAQGKVTALLSAMMSIGALTVAAYFAQEAFIPMMKKRLQLEEGEEEEERVHSRRLQFRSKRSVSDSNEEEEERDDLEPSMIRRSERITVIPAEQKRPVYVAAGISLFAIATSIYFGRKAWLNLAGRISKLPPTE